MNNRINGFVRIGIVLSIIYAAIEVYFPYRKAMGNAHENAITEVYHRISLCNSYRKILPEMSGIKPEDDCQAWRKQQDEIEENFESQAYYDATTKSLNIIYAWIAAFATFWTAKWIQKGFVKSK